MVRFFQSLESDPDRVWVQAASTQEEDPEDAVARRMTARRRTLTIAYLAWMVTFDRWLLFRMTIYLQVDPAFDMPEPAAIAMGVFCAFIATMAALAMIARLYGQEEQLTTRT